jgi:hypothetical protein
VQQWNDRGDLFNALFTKSSAPAPCGGSRPSPYKRHDVMHDVQAGTMDISTHKDVMVLV